MEGAIRKPARRANRARASLGTFTQAVSSLNSPITVICRGCARALVAPVAEVRRGATLACAHCGAANDLGLLAASLPRHLVVEAAPRERSVSEFP